LHYQDEIKETNQIRFEGKKSIEKNYIQRNPLKEEKEKRESYYLILLLMDYCFLKDEDKRCG
jgi:hypothetical protein